MIHFTRHTRYRDHIVRINPCGKQQSTFRGTQFLRKGTQQLVPDTDPIILIDVLKMSDVRRNNTELAIHALINQLLEFS